MAYYYAVIDDNSICTDVLTFDEEMNEPNWISIEIYSQDYIGMWYDANTGTFHPEGKKYLNQLVNVDGTGSGLDADKLDGLEASAFALANHTHESSGTVPEHEHDEYALVDHTHTGYALVDHTHTGYADADHSHTGYAPASHSHTGYADDSAVVHKAGEEIITGSKINQANVFVNKTNANLVLKVTNLTKGTKSTAASYDGVAVQDKSGNVLANMRYCQETDGDAYLQFKAFDYTGDASDPVDMRLYKPAGATPYAQLPKLVRLSSGNQAIYETDDYMIFGTGNKPTLIACKSDSPVTVNGVRMDVPSLVPRNTNTHGIGLSGQRFTNCYLVNSPNVSSDRRLKENIEDVDADDMLAFIDALNVVNYNYKDDPEVERIGLIAQDVEEAGGAKFVEVGEDGMYGLKTADLVYPLIGAVQALYSRVLELEAQLKK